MAYIDPDGMFGGDRMALLSDVARMAWPWFWCASNTVGRVELNYREFVNTVFRQFKQPPTESEFWNWVAEYHECHLLYVYEISGKVWGQWWTSEKYLPTYKTVGDKRTPAPMAGEYLTWQREYESQKSAAISGKCRVLNNSKNLQNFSGGTEPPEKFTLGVERKGEERLRNGKEEENPQTPYAPSGAFALESTTTGGNEKPPAKSARIGKRTTEAIRKALGPERLKWWEEFWKVYPCREGMKPGMDAFEVKIKTRELASEAYRGARRYAAKCAADPTIRVKYAQGWINDERWTDEILETTPVRSKQQEQADAWSRA